MGFFDQLSASISKTAKEGVESAKTLVDKNRVRRDIGAIESEMRSRFAEIGEKLYAMTAENPDPDFAELFAAVADLKTALADKKAEAMQLEGKYACEKCGTVNPKDARFCQSCGAPAPEPPAAEAAPAGPHHQRAQVQESPLHHLHRAGAAPHLLPGGQGEGGLPLPLLRGEVLGQEAQVTGSGRVARALPLQPCHTKTEHQNRTTNQNTKKSTPENPLLRGVPFCQNETGCKPGYVVDGHLSSPAVAGRLKQPTRTVPSGNREAGGPPICPVRSCFGWGLHVPRTLPHGRWSLTPPLHPYRLSPAVYFCCTGLGVASTGRYPASCPVKPGLSSPAAFRLCSRDRLPVSEPYFITGACA